MASNILPKIQQGGKVACFGSRETPDDVLEVMTKLAEKIVRLGGVVASGHCHGADLAFERGASIIPSQLHVCLPWATYNKEIPIVTGAKVEVLTNLPQAEQASLMKGAEKYHGAWHRLTNGGKLLHTRNLLIGRNAVVGFCYLNKNKVGGGGSGQCFRYLMANNIPVHDLATRDGMGLAVGIITMP